MFEPREAHQTVAMVAVVEVALESVRDVIDLCAK